MISSNRHGLSLIELLVVLFVIGLLLALLLPAVQSAREAARVTNCRSNLRQFGIAIGAYESTYGILPPGGSNGFSLHVALLPFMDQGAVFGQIDRSANPVDEPINSAIARLPIDTFMCPSDGAASLMAGNAYAGTNYAGNYGIAAQRDGFNGFFRYLYPSGLFGPHGPLRFADIVDGLSNTGAMSEMCVSDGGTERLRIVYGLEAPGLGSAEAVDLFASRCRDTPPSSPANIWTKARPWIIGAPSMTLYNHLLAPNGNSCSNNGLAAGAYTASSMHRGGVNVLFGDGHVNFVNENTKTAIWHAIGSRMGGERITF